MRNLTRAMNGAAQKPTAHKPANGTGVSWFGRQRKVRAMGAAHARLVNPRMAAMLGMSP